MFRLFQNTNMYILNSLSILSSNVTAVAGNATNINAVAADAGARSAARDEGERREDGGPTKIGCAGRARDPDSAFKTAQAIKDFNREGLPLIVFANWRGFSGGMNGIRHL